jgi:peptide/nickel transport system ATP-binding protein
MITGGSVVFHDADGSDIDLHALDAEQMRRFRWDKVSMVFQGAMNALNPWPRSARNWTTCSACTGRG